jgi:AraC-like DNA-binding protein
MRKTISIPAACRERYASLGDDLLASWAKAGFTRAGVSHVVDGYHIASPAHGDAIVIATMSGRGRFISRKESSVATAGMVALCPASTPVIFSCDGPDWCFAWCYLDARRWSFPNEVSLQRWAGNTTWSSCLEGALHLTATQRNTRPRGIRLQVDVVLDELRSLLGEAHRSDVYDAYEDAWQQVLDALHESWPVARFARMVQTSVPSVQRWAHRRFQCSFHHQVMHVRMRQAGQILRATDYTLAQVAALVGYGDAFTFSAAFRQHIGRPPSLWRKMPLADTD